MQITVFSENELSGAAEQLLAAFPSDRVFCFYGEMGVGKTTFIKRICSRLGAVDTTSSPTFAIVNEYLTNRNESIYHFDFYRIADPGLMSEDLAEAVEADSSVTVVEWGQSIQAILPESRAKITITYIDENTRELTIEESKK